MPLAAIYSSAAMKPYREWLTAYFLKSVASLGGSLISDRIEDYYVDPIELGYGSLVDWDRDFVGSAALREKKANTTRTKVTLVWNDDDTARVMADAIYGRDGGAQYIAMPCPMYAHLRATR